MRARRSGSGISGFGSFESFGAESLKDANKRQNKAGNYKKAVSEIRKRGIAVMAGFIAGFDHDDEKSIVEMADQLMEIGIDVPFLSIMTPFAGTPIYDKLEQEDRIIEPKDWDFYNGYNVAFRPLRMTAPELLAAHRKLWARSFSFTFSAQRILRALSLNWGAFLMVFFMNTFYCLKKLRKNYPVDMGKRKERPQATASQPQPSLLPSTQTTAARIPPGGSRIRTPLGTRPT